MVSPIVNYAIRGFQAVFASVVLGLSVTLVRNQGPGLASPLSLRYAAFVGGFTLLAAFVGVAAEFLSALQGKVVFLLDGLVTLISISGGVLLAVLIGGANCGDASLLNRAKLFENDLFNGGCEGKGDNRKCWNGFGHGREKYLNSRCKESQATSVFMFFVVGLMFASMTMTFLRSKKGY
ncbi:hypothetical protein DM02DRAFT_610357 [Periconia macrospinosa]|uniref:MARVEL domain-containing protein n=1 Tax=Periconia macrospinosa TaxID=97972 RepID=A0A2V1E9M5_9PLEO|nr:hypothetical protein DM02DRAFT_610357 [Periconia macrospinosa]